MIWLLQFFFVKCSNYFLAVKMTNKICPRNSIFNFFNHKNLSRPIWSVIFYKNVLIFLYSYMITNFKFRIFLIIFFIKVNICAWPYINRLHFCCAMIWHTLLCLLTMSANLSIWIFFYTEVTNLQILFFEALINLSVTTYFSSLSVKYNSVSLSFNHGFIDRL